MPLPRVSSDLRSLLSGGVGGRWSAVDTIPWSIDKVVTPNDVLHDMGS
jgi:hypothetical protein